MKRGLLLLVVILLSAGVAFAQLPGSAAVYADQAGTSCSIAAVGFLQLFYYQAGSLGSTAIEFHSTVLEDTPAGSLNFFGDSSPFPLKMQMFHQDCSMALQACLLGDIYLGSATYGVTGTPVIPECTKFYTTGISIPSIPGSTKPTIVDCATNLVELTGSYFIINPTGSCPCTGSLPVNESSWGKIKSLYE